VWAAAAAALLIAAGVTLYIRNDRRPSPGTVPLITNASGRVVLVLPDEADVPATEPRPSRDDTPLIFNNAGVVAAVVPGGEPRFLMIGGGS
jgi:hypothetical protein